MPSCAAGSAAQAGVAAQTHPLSFVWRARDPSPPPARRFIKKLRNHPDKVLPSRSDVTMTSPFMDAYVRLLIKTCHKRGVHAMGGMAAQIPIKGDAAANEAALTKVGRGPRGEGCALWLADGGQSCARLRGETNSMHAPTHNAHTVYTRRCAPTSCARCRPATTAPGWRTQTWSRWGGGAGPGASQKRMGAAAPRLKTKACASPPSRTRAAVGSNSLLQACGYHRYKRGHAPTRPAARPTSPPDRHGRV